MSVILVLVAFSVTVAIGFLIAFFWSVRNGQYDDTYSSSVRILFEDDKPPQSDTGASSPANNLKEQPPNK
jgi:cbb3-type cytochrome oxidase maturation protein